MKPVCVLCERFMRPKRNGMSFIEGMPADGEQNPAPGLREPARWQPYKLWNGDCWACPDCGATIIVGFAQRPAAERHHADFADQIASHGAELLVKDC